MKLTHEEMARLIDRYRERAEDIVKDYHTHGQIAVNKHGAVQIAEDGAFVECMIWIPKEEL